jgi:hypothetical protein
MTFSLTWWKLLHLVPWSLVLWLHRKRQMGITIFFSCCLRYQKDDDTIMGLPCCSGTCHSSALVWSISATWAQNIRLWIHVDHFCHGIVRSQSVHFVLLFIQRTHTNETWAISSTLNVSLYGERTGTPSVDFRFITENERRP